jgi:hypothetical protein
MRNQIFSTLILILISQYMWAQPQKQYSIKIELEVAHLKPSERVTFFNKHTKIPISYCIHNHQTQRRKYAELDLNKRYTFLIEDFFNEDDEYLTIEIDLLREKKQPYFFSGKGNVLYPIWAESPDTLWVKQDLNHINNLYYNKEKYRIKCWPISYATDYIKKDANTELHMSLPKNPDHAVTNENRFDKFIQYLLNERLIPGNNLASIFNVGLYLANRANKVSGADSSLNVLISIKDKINVADLAIVNQKAFFKDAMYYLYLANNFDKNMTYQAKKAFDDIIIDSINANPNQKNFFFEIADSYYNSDLIKKDKSKFPVEKTDKENIQKQFCLIGKGIGKEINCAH